MQYEHLMYLWRGQCQLIAMSFSFNQVAMLLTAGVVWVWSAVSIYRSAN